MSTDEPLVKRTQDPRGAVTLTLTSPQAYTPCRRRCSARCSASSTRIAADDSVRVVVLAAEGKAFCAGPAGDAGATLAGLHVLIPTFDREPVARAEHFDLKSLRR
jgi:enoyl-CoA hydratase/carnithine racemase